jgi:hypothetical protein
MIRTIARHEWRVLSADKTPWLILLLLGVSIGYAVLNGVRWVRFQERTLQDGEAERVRRYGDLKQLVADIEAGTKRAPFNDPGCPMRLGAAWHGHMPQCHHRSFRLYR